MENVSWISTASTTKIWNWKGNNAGSKTNPRRQPVDNRRRRMPRWNTDNSKGAGMDGWCSHHHRLTSCLVVEQVWHDWASGVDHTVSNIDETDPLRSIRMIPIYGRRHRLVEMLNEMGMYTAGLSSPPRERDGGLWIPNSICRIDGERI